MKKINYISFIDNAASMDNSISRAKESIDNFVIEHYYDCEPSIQFIYNYDNEKTTLFDVYDALMIRIMKLCHEKVQMNKIEDDEYLVVFIMGNRSSNVQNACIKIAEYIALIPNMKFRAKILFDGTLLMIATTLDLIIQEFVMNYNQGYPTDDTNIMEDTYIQCAYTSLISDYIAHLVSVNEMDLETMDCHNPSKVFLLTPNMDNNHHQKNIKNILDMKTYDRGNPYPRAKTHIIHIDDLEKSINELTHYEVMNLVIAVPFGDNDDWEFNMEYENDIMEFLDNVVHVKNEEHKCYSRIMHATISSKDNLVKFHMYGLGLIIQRLNGEAFTAMIIDELSEGI